MKNASYWACSKGEGLCRYEIAGEQAPKDWAGYARQLLCSNAGQVDWLEYFNSAADRYRAARMVGGTLESCLFIGPEFNMPSRDWLSQLFEQGSLDDTDRTSLLTGKPGLSQKDVGRIVCACFSVGINTFKDAIQTGNLTSAEQIGEVLKAGTNCGSCVPELKSLLVECV
ncbi:MAG: (2Fe-2S)-binding protein [Pseudomonadota bacterium]|nr:(2Fe-2S)-binding protein [Pseudomonadota bacterium]